MTKQEGGDLPGKCSQAFVSPQEQNEREPDDIARFSREVRKTLESNSYTIYTLTGKTMADLREITQLGDRLVNHAFISELVEIGKIPSRKSEVAIIKIAKWLRGWIGESIASFEEQQEMIQAHAQEISRQVPGVDTIIGALPDYVELALQYESRHKKPFFKYGGQYARTTTPTYFKKDGSPDHTMVIGNEWDNLIHIATVCTKATDVLTVFEFEKHYRPIGIIPLIIPSVIQK